jgi:[protein-PII] uridylyltransferase
MPQTGHFEKVLAHAAASLTPLRREAKTPAERLQVYRRFLKKENHRLKLQHKQGAGGLDLARRRAAMLDVVIIDLFDSALECRGIDPKTRSKKGDSGHPVTLVANGGYGRALLNPGSDIDLLFLLPENAKGISEDAKEIVAQIHLMLNDTGFKVGYGVRTISEAIAFANRDHPTKTALLDARFIAGDAALFDTFATKFHKGCLKGQERDYLTVRSEDIRSRHKKWGNTIHLQEPNVKEGCGGLRDHHNLIWVLWVLRQSRDLKALVSEGRLTLSAYKEIENAHEFLMRVRNGLHYAQKGKSGDILTLRHQGIVATAFGYPQPTILRRSEAFMRDYYFHTRNLFQHSTSIMQGFELEVVDDDASPVPFIGFLARRRVKKEEHFDSFFSREGLIYPESADIFTEDPNRMMRAFLHAQQRHLALSPEIRKLFKSNYALISKDFRKLKSNRETFERILQQPGEVAHILRLMHRVGFLGRYLPEFGALTDLVQHEFFHRYSADEHTLRCIEQLDAVATSDDPKTAFFQHLFRELEDPFILYLALILHDTGRAENMRHHEDASAMLASHVCTRLRIEGERRRRLTFLVDHHLTFWRYATTRNLDDPGTVAEFAAAVQNRAYLETLFLFTYVDSRGTNEEAWSDWKFSLMTHLYRNTLEWFEDRKAFSDKAQQPRTAQKEKVIEKMAADFGEEIEAHFEKMPERYFRFRGRDSIVRHLRLFRRFFEKLQLPGTGSLIPVVGWEARPAEGFSLVEVVGWNRHHFLAKVAGALAARNLNILSADLFTREDDLVLDIFRVCTTNFGPVKSEREMERVEKLITQVFGVDANEPEVDFQTLIGRERSPSPYQNSLEIEIPQRVWVSNQVSEDHTVLELQAQDRIGLLYDVFTALGNLDAEVVHARISTQAGAAIDRFHLADSRTAKKIADKARLKEIEQAIAKVVGI